MGFRKHLGLPCKVEGCNKPMGTRGLCVNKTYDVEFLPETWEVIGVTEVPDGIL